MVQALWHRLQRWAERRLPALTRYRRLESLPIRLHRRRIYVVPTRFGAAFAVLLLVMLIGSLNYGNNAALMLTCLLGAASAASMLVAFRNLDGLGLRSIRTGTAVAGDRLRVELEFDPDERPREAIRAGFDGQAQFDFALEGSNHRLALELPTERRGWMPLPRLRVSSEWPWGLFHAWSWLYPEQSALIWPRPELEGPPPRQPIDDPGRRLPRQGDDLSHLRDYRAGDPQRHVAWKASARHHGLLVKEFERPRERQHWHLDWRQLHGLDDEMRIARISRWLDEARARGLPSSLWLPDQEIGSGSGAEHHARAMDALAKLP